MLDTWEFPSNSGRGSVTATLLDLVEIGDTPTYVVSLSMRVERPWNEASEEVRLKRVEMPRARLHAAQTALAAWLQDHEPLTCSLTADAGSTQLTLSLAPESTFVSSRERPVCRFRFAADLGLEGSCAWVIDQSCVRLWLDDVDRWLRIGVG